MSEEPDLIDWRGLSQKFKESPRKLGLSFRTIQAWQAMGMPYTNDGRRLLFSFPECWDWYKTHFHRGKAAA